MARIFNIYFSYNGTMHNAIVSVRTASLFTEYILTHFDEDLLLLLPGNKILYTAADGLFFQSAGQGNSDVLMKEIIRALREHLHVAEAG